MSPETIFKMRGILVSHSTKIRVVCEKRKWRDYTLMRTLPHVLRKTTFMAIALMLALTPVFAPNSDAANPEAEALYTQAMQAYEQKALIKAADLFKKATEKDDQFVNAWYNLGAVNYRLERYADAQYAFQKALWRSPSDMEIRYHLAMSLNKLNRNSEALQQLERITAASPKYAEAQTTIAQLKSKGVTSAATTTVATSTGSSTPAKVTPSNAGTASGITAMGISSTGVYAKGFVGPTGLAVGPAGELYVANYTKNSIVKIDSSGKAETLAQGGAINGPIGLVRDPRNGNLYVANYISGDIVTISGTGQISTLKQGYGKPYYLYFDALTNRLFVTEQQGNQVSVIKL
jgi:tetratricopeptide (TPR) repeat protein